MFKQGNFITGLTISDIGTSIKIPIIEINGQTTSVGGLILDIVTKLSIASIPNIQDGVLTRVQDRVRLEIEHIIVSDGFSLRRLELTELRNAFTLKGSGKLSVKNTKSDIPNLAADFTDLGLKATGLSVLQPAWKIGKRLLGKTRVTGNMSHTSPFGANLEIGEERVGEFSSITHKWNKYSLQGDESKFSNAESLFSGKPVIRSTSELSIGSTNGQQLAARMNIPIFGLSRDHARDVIISVESIIHAIDYVGHRIQVASAQSHINLGQIEYKTLIKAS